MIFKGDADGCIDGTLVIVGAAVKLNSPTTVISTVAEKLTGEQYKVSDDRPCLNDILVAAVILVFRSQDVKSTFVIHVKPAPGAPQYVSVLVQTKLVSSPFNISSTYLFP